MFRKLAVVVGSVLLVIALGAALVAPPIAENALAAVAVVATIGLLAILTLCTCSKSLPNFWIVLLLAIVVIGLLVLAWKAPDTLSNPATTVAIWAEEHYKLLVVLGSVGGILLGISGRIKSDAPSSAER